MLGMERGRVMGYVGQVMNYVLLKVKLSFPDACSGHWYVDLDNMPYSPDKLKLKTPLGFCSVFTGFVHFSEACVSVWKCACVAV